MMARRLLAPAALLWTAITISLILTRADTVLVDRQLVHIPSSLLFAMMSAISWLLLFLADPASHRTAWSSLRANSLPLAGLSALTALSLATASTGWANWQPSPQFVWLLPINLVAFVVGLSLGSFRSVHAARHAIFSASFVVLGASVLADVLFPGTFSTLATRAAGFARNANLAGFLMVVLLALIISWRQPRPADYVRISFAALTVLATLSRGGILLLTFTVTIWVLRHFACRQVSLRVRPNARTTAQMLAGVALPILLLSVVALKSPMLSNSTTRARAVRVAATVGGLNPNEQRLGLVRQYVELIGERPLLGHGTGYRDQLPLGPHNTYLALWTDHGAVGVLAYLATLASLLLVFHARGSTVGLVLVIVTIGEGMFTHNLLDHRPMFLLFGLVLSFSWREFNLAIAGSGAHDLRHQD